MESGSHSPRSWTPKLFQYATVQIGVAPATGGEAKVLTLALDRNSTVPRFSADGKWIYFIADDDGTQNLLRVPAAAAQLSGLSADEKWSSHIP